MRRFIVVFGLCFWAGTVLANDSSAEMAAGGLELVRTDAVRMVSEDLYISADEVRVDYVYRNLTDQDVDTLVAFPMPIYDATPFEPTSIPYPDQENFLGFTVFVDGVDVAPQLEQRALAFGVDVSRDLVKLGVPLTPFSQSAFDAVEALDAEAMADLEARGVIILDMYDVGQGMQAHPTPYWQLQSTYWWRMVFPANAEVRVSHSYTPAVGATAGIGGADYQTGQFTPDYVEKYCIDDAFQRAVDRRMAETSDLVAPLWEQRIAYVLMTANNWYGPIERFHLTVDKGSENNLVSFCATGLTKTGPTTFEATYTEFVPERDLDILLLEAAE